MHFLAVLYRLALSLRYRVTLRNAEVLEGSRPVLLLSNHQALVDPQILLCHVYAYKQVSPMVTERFFNAPLLHTVLQRLGAIEVPSISTAQENTVDAGALFQRAIDALKQGKSVLLYPSGQLTGQGTEAINGKQSAYAIAKSLPPNTKVVAVRIRGLWGSMWSKAWIGRTPNFVLTALKAIWYIVANGLFFAPRRPVALTFEDVTEDAVRLSKSDAHHFNTFLEEFFNREGEEPVLFLKHVFYALALQRALPATIDGSIADMRNVRIVHEAEIDPEVLPFVIQKIGEMRELEPAMITSSSHLILDLHFDSLNLAEIVAILQQHYPRSGNPPLSRIKTVADLCLMAQGLSIDDKPLKPCMFDAYDLPADPLHAATNSTMQKQFIDMLASHPNAPFCFDALMGSTTRRDFLTKADVVSELLKGVTKDQYVGLMLPALQGASLLILATYLAKKIPVMLNWTMGEKALRHCMETVHLEKIVTVRAFFETVKDQIPQELYSRFIFLEEEMKHVSLLSKLKGFALARIPHLAFAHRRYPETAVILFTSGSEALPKAVPLTQKNILADINGVLDVFPLSTDDRLLGFLPPFHSFGFTVTCILPLLTGLRTAYTPNPSDVRAILRLIRHTKATLVPSTPTFLKLILQRAGRDDLQSLRIAVTGAESCPDSVRKKFASVAPMTAKIIEGYGITECSPVVTINPFDRPKAGSVGRPILGVDCIVTALDSEKSLPANEQGMIYVHGESVFPGYLDPKLASPFVEIQGKSYYKTGDLGYIDTDGYLFITGRLKRFIKIGGEMISLPFIENILLEKYGDIEETVLAVEGSDQLDPPEIVLFSTKKLDLKEVSAFLRSQGVSNLIRIDRIITLDAIPVLGTGKVDYKLLKQYIR